VVATQHHHTLGVLHLQSHQQQNHLDTHRPTVHVVPQEQQVLLRRCLQRGEETYYLEQVEELAMNVADNDDRFVDLQDIGLLL
jgi:hypothetical protein